MHVSNSMRMEGDAGYMFTTVTWDDGAQQDVGYAPAGGGGELRVSSGTPNVELTPPLSAGSGVAFSDVSRVSHGHGHEPGCERHWEARAVIGREHAQATAR